MSKEINRVDNEVQSYISEARALLPKLPDDISFVWDDSLIITGHGTGGTLFRPTVLGIGYDSSFEDKNRLAKNLRATVLHECFHAVQGWSDEEPTSFPESLLEDAVFEGAATVFERDFGGTIPLWSLYENDEVMNVWLSEIKAQQLDPNSEQYFEYKFGTVAGTKWMLYKLGTWIIDKALARNPKVSIIDLSELEPKKIIKLAGI